MEQVTETKSKILDAISTAQQSATGKMEIYANNEIKSEDFKNELVFFIKPEVTKMPTDTIPAILDIIFEKLAKFDVNVMNIQLLGASYLKDNNIMAAHYGAINKLAANPKACMSQKAKDNFKDIFGSDVADAPIYGGTEFLEKKEGYTPETLETDLWMTKKSTKLDGGTYCVPVEVKGETIYLINGFHPNQLNHYTAEGRSIIAFHVASNTDWSVLRNDLTGATFPPEAVKDSLRGTFLEKKEELSIEDVSMANNCVHLSAGPIESTVEISRFFDGVDKLDAAMNERPFAKTLKEKLGEEKTLHILTDGKIEVDGNVVGSFDAMEEKNADETIDLLCNAKILIEEKAAA